MIKIILFSLLLPFFINVMESGEPEVLPEATVVSSPVNDNEWLILNLVNQKRIEAGVKPVVIDYNLAYGSDSRAFVLKRNNQWSHEGFVDAFNGSGFNGHKIGENLARNWTDNDPDMIVDAWMNSELHRRNVLDPAYTYGAVGSYQDYVVLWLGNKSLL